MGYSGYKITPPVSIHDVQGAVSYGNSDLGGLITGGSINKWAKYKPVRLALIDTTGQLNNDKTRKSSATWWKANNGNCGITFRTYSSIADCKSAIDSKESVWGYERPGGGSTQPYRLVDFNYYNVMALPPTSDIATEQAVLQAGATCRIMAAKSPSTGDNITLADIGSFENYYFTVAIYDGTTLKLIHSQSNTFGEGGEAGDIELSIPYNDGVNGGYQGVLVTGVTYKVYPFLSSRKYTCATTAQLGTYIPLPHDNDNYGVQPCDLTATDASSWLRVEAYASGTLVQWSAYCYHGGTPDATIRLTDAAGNPLSGQNVSYDFSFANGTQVETNVYRVNSGLHVLQLPSPDSELYRVELVTTGMHTIAVIGHDI